jgi:hypothetical protein
MPRIRTKVQVMFFDTDCGGVVSNIAYLRFVETARTLLAEELGLALAEMAQTQDILWSYALRSTIVAPPNLAIDSSLKAGSMNWSVRNFGAHSASFDQRTMC